MFCQSLRVGRMSSSSYNSKGGSQTSGIIEKTIENYREYSTIFYNLDFFLSSYLKTYFLKRVVPLYNCSVWHLLQAAPRNGAKKAGNRHQRKKEWQVSFKVGWVVAALTFGSGTHCQREPFQRRALTDGNSCWEPVPGATAKSNRQKGLLGSHFGSRENCH